MPASIADSRDELVGSLSLGLQRRVAFAVAFSHRPELLVLDEPTSGVGPLSRARLWQDIRESAEHGTGVLVTTHNMEEAEQCDRLVVMVDGRVAAEGTAAGVIGSRTVVQVACDDWRRAFAALDAEGLMVQVQGDVLRVTGSPGRGRGPSGPARPPRGSGDRAGQPRGGVRQRRLRGIATMSRTGRRPGAPETREDILAAARRAFGDRGYEATSLRSIADRVHVDPALLVHYFGSKEGLFLAALEVTVGPSALFSGLSTLDVREAAELIVGRYLTVLDQEQTRDVVLALVRSAVSSERAATMLREFLVGEMLACLSPLIDQPDGRVRASLVVAQLIGIAVLRHVVKLDAVVRASDDELISLVAPVIEGYLR